EHAKRAIETGTVQKPYLIEIKKKDGSVALLEVKESPYKDSSGEVVGLIGAVNDVTEQVKTARAFRESEEKFRRLFEDSGDAQFLLDGTMIIDCNNEAVK